MKNPRSIFKNRDQVRAAQRALKPGSVRIFEHQHETWCRRPQGGVCTCTPTVVVKPYIDPRSN